MDGTGHIYLVIGDTVVEDTAVSLREHFEALMVAQEQRHQADMAGLKELMDTRFVAQETAVIKSEDSYNSRFALANEFRSAMSDLSGTFATKKTVDEKSEESGRRIGAIENRLANLDGRMIGYSAGVGLVVLIISIATQLINFGG